MTNATNPDDVKRYAESVASGEIIANAKIKAAAGRLLAEIENPPAGFVYDPTRWQAVQEWCRYSLEIVLHGEPRPMEFLPWQSFVLGQAVNWYRAAGGVRYRIVSAEAARGSGKSAACLAYSLYRMANRDHQQILVTAQGLRQLRDIWLREADAMLAASQKISEQFQISSMSSVSPMIRHKANASSMVFLANTGRSLQGYTASLVITDELGETAHGADWIEALEQGITKNNSAAIVSITTPPPANLSAGPYALRRLNWEKQAEQPGSTVLYLPWGLDPDDNIEDEQTWPKAFAPGFDAGLRTVDDYRELLERDRGQDTLHNFELRQCCRETTGGGDWLPPQWIERAEVEIGLEALRGCDCWAGLDMSKSGDLTSLAVIFDLDGTKVLSLWHFLPELGKATKFRTYGPNLEGWKALPHVHVSESPLIDYEAVSGRLHWLAEHANLRIVKFDDWAGPGDERIRELLADQAIPFSEQKQTGKEWSGATSQAKTWFACDETYDPVFRVRPDPLLIFAAGNLKLLEDSNGNVRLTKQKSLATIDPMIAVVLAVAGYTEEAEERSIFDAGPMMLG